MSPRCLLAALLVAVAGCSSGEDPAGAGGGGPTGPCPPGEALLETGACLVAGMQPDGCAAGQVSVPGGGCRSPGVAPDACAEGFVHDGMGGCDPILPAMPCADGQLAVPGDTACREVAPCAPGTWGAIPLDATTQHVDASFMGTSTGSSAAPWTIIQQAIDAASAGVIVAVATGAYAEDVIIAGQPVRLWGVCPAEVSVSSIDVQVDGVEIHDLAVSGAGDGVLIGDASGVLLERLWIHDTGGWGVRAAGSPQASLTVRGTLVERAYERGIYLEGMHGAIERTAITDTAPAPLMPGFGGGRAINVRDHLGTRARGSVIIDHVYVSGSSENALMIHASDATVDASVVRDTLPSLEGRFGRAISVQRETSSGERGRATIRGSLFERARDGGIAVTGGEAIIESTVIRDIAPNQDVGDRGYGVAAQHVMTGDGGVPLTLSGSLVERASEIGVFASGSTVVIEASIVRDTRATVATGTGRAIAMQADEAALLDADLTLRQSLLEGAYEVGVYVQGARGTLEGVLVRDIMARPTDGSFGRGIDIEPDPLSGAASEAAVRWSVVERSHEAGVFCAGSDCIVESTRVSDILPGTGVDFAIGIVGQQALGHRRTLTLEDSLVERAIAAGVNIAGAEASVAHTAVIDTRAGPESELFGDGIQVMYYLGSGAATVTDSRIAASARAGLAVFGASELLGTTELECNRIHLATQSLAAEQGLLTDLGGNRCGCNGVPEECRAIDAQLQPPVPLAPTE